MNAPNSNVDGLSLAAGIRHHGDHTDGPFLAGSGG